MSRKEDMDKLNSLLAEVNALAEKINKEYSESAIMENKKPDVLAAYKTAFVYKEKSDGRAYYLDANSEVKNCPIVSTCCPFTGGDRCASDYNNSYHMYLTEEYAKKAAKMKKFNDMLLAFKWCYDRTYEPDWSDSDSLKYYVYYNIGEERYISDCTFICDTNTIYFSTGIGAKVCVNWLNSIDPKGELMR